MNFPVFESTDTSYDMFVKMNEFQINLDKTKYELLLKITNHVFNNKYKYKSLSLAKYLDFYNLNFIKAKNIFLIYKDEIKKEYKIDISDETIKGFKDLFSLFKTLSKRINFKLVKRTIKKENEKDKFVYAFAQRKS